MNIVDIVIYRKYKLSFRNELVAAVFLPLTNTAMTSLYNVAINLINNK